MEEDDRFIRFHAAQSMVVFGGLFVLAIIVNLLTPILALSNGFFLMFVGMVFSLVWILISLASLVLWVYLMVSAYKGERPRLPIAAGIADSLI